MRFTTSAGRMRMVGIVLPSTRGLAPNAAFWFLEAPHWNGTACCKPLLPDELEISQVNDAVEHVGQDSHQVRVCLARLGVRLQNEVEALEEAPHDAEPPKSNGDDNCLPPLRRNPLDNEAAQKKQIAGQSQQDPRGHVETKKRCVR